jgi:uncharacterized protein (DUF1697 family)
MRPDRVLVDLRPSVAPTAYVGMPQYVALLRGIGPTHPNMRNEKLATVLRTIGCTDVRPVLASGNLVFRSNARNGARLEAAIERALHEQLGLSLDVMVRSQDELETLVRKDPFKGAEHGKAWYLTVTFHKDRRAPLFSKLDRATMDGPEFMADLERRHGKHITTRTWNTIGKIRAALADTPRRQTALAGDRSRRRAAR